MNEASGEYYNVNVALEHLRKAVNIDPAKPAYRLLLADCSQKFKEFIPNSITEYNNILNTMNVASEITKKAYSGLAMAYLASEKDEEAFLTIKNGLKLFPDDYVMNLNAGQIFAKSKKKEEAEECFKKALQIDPEDVRSYMQFPTLYIEDKQFDKAIEIYKMGMAKLPNVPILPLNLGLLYSLQLENCEKAIEMLQKALDLKISISFVPHVEIGKCLMSQGKLDEALEMLEKALKEALDMDSKYASECRFHIAEIYKSKKDVSKMKEYIQKIIESDPNSAWAENGKKLLQDTGVN
jgi:tetratricopeptide (TPR) repeat protein